jgi:hypothetical protein
VAPRSDPPDRNELGALTETFESVFVPWCCRQKLQP